MRSATKIQKNRERPPSPSGVEDPLPHHPLALIHRRSLLRWLISAPSPTLPATLPSSPPKGDLLVLQQPCLGSWVLNLFVAIAIIVIIVVILLLLVPLVLLGLNSLLLLWSLPTVTIAITFSTLSSSSTLRLGYLWVGDGGGSGCCRKIGTVHLQRQWMSVAEKKGIHNSKKLKRI